MPSHPYGSLVYINKNVQDIRPLREAVVYGQAQRTGSGVLG
jgi:hypothetical protein